MHGRVMLLLGRGLVQGKPWMSPDVNRNPTWKLSILGLLGGVLLAVAILTPGSETAPIMFTPYQETILMWIIFQRCSGFTASQRIFLLPFLCWDTILGGQVFRKVIGAFWSFLWGNNCSVTSLCFSAWALGKKLVFLRSQETVFFQWAEITFPACTPLTLFHFI